MGTLSRETAFIFLSFFHSFSMGVRGGWVGGAMVLGKFPVLGHPTVLILIILGQGPTMLAVGADEGCLNIFLSFIISLLSPSLWGMAQYRLKYCLKGLLGPKNNQPTSMGIGNNIIFSASLHPTQ